jgi:DnaJ-class molecular chaperone
MATKSVKAKKGFMDCYKKSYNPDVEGYGDETQWNNAFKHRMGWDEAKTILDNDDAYSILGILATATLAEIKKAFKTLIFKWHPDRNSSLEAGEKSQKIIAAYTFLTSKK